MTLSGPQKIPFANTTSAWFEGTYLGSPMEVNVGLLHTTEGPSLSDYSGGSVAPNVTGVPDFATQKIKWYQHFSVDRSARALVNAAGGVETNTLNVFQIELVGTCDPATHNNWVSHGIQHVYWPEAPDWALAGVGVLVRWLSDNHNVPMTSSVTFKAYPGSYGTNNGVRLSGAQWSAYKGWLGHEHAPENLHGDPGNIDIGKILAFAKGDNTGGTDVPLTTDDIDKVAAAVYDKFAGDGAVINTLDLNRIWSWDYIPAATPPYNNPDYFAADGTTIANDKWGSGYAQYAQVMAGREAVARVKAVEAKIDALATGGVDLDALAVKVADLLAKRLES